MLAGLSTAALLGGFALAALVVLLTGMRITKVVDRLADRTGLGEALAGAVLLGAATSLGGTIVSVTVATDGLASLAYSNSIGGIAAQTAFLAIADLTYRKANLEHAAADLANIFQAVVLIVLLTLPLIAMTAPEVTVMAVHPVSLAIPAVYVAALLPRRACATRRCGAPWTPPTPAPTPPRPRAPPAAPQHRAALRRSRGADGGDGGGGLDHRQGGGRAHGAAGDCRDRSWGRWRRRW